ncbi:unnamed protein product [Bathycoccus prasinos]
MSTLSSRCGLLSSTTTLAPFRKGAKQSSPLVSSNFNSSSGRRKSFAISNAATISFVKGDVETSVPDVKLTKSRDGTSGTAFFTFENPDVFESATGDITGMYLSDEEGEMTTVDVNAKFVNGKPKCIEARYIMRSSQEWERFMRFMTRYAEDNGLGFNKTS